MGQYRIFSEPLGVDFMVEGSEAPNEESTFQILKQVVPPDRMIKAFEDGNKELARAAYKNGYFDQESDTGLYDAFKQAAGEVMEGLGDISKEVSLDFTASGAMTYGVPGSQKLVEGARAEQQKRRRKRKATGYQTMAEVFAGYKTIGDAGKLAFSKMAGEGDEDIDASIQFIGDMMKTQSFIDDGAAIMAEQFGDFDMYRDLKAGRVEPDKKQALAASLFVQLENPVAAVTTGGIRSTTNMLRRGTAKKLAEQLKEANSKKFLLEKQLNRLPANASDTLVKTATDALEKATKESDEILAKITPFTEQKAKAGFTNQMVGKGMQAVGKAGEHFGNLTEFIRRAGVEEATTILMRAGLSEQVAKGVIYTSIGGAADLTDGEASLTGTGFGALAAYMGPRAIASMGRSSAILGKQLTMAETTMPFFKRVGALPADDPKLAEVLVDRTDNLVLGDAASQLKPILTQTRDLPSTVRGAARFIDRSGLGRLGTETANVAKAAAGGAALPGAFGYMAGGEEGAASAIGASAPFIAAGLGYGSLLRFNNKSDLLAKQLGDLEYHKQSLTETERTNFEKLDKDQQVAISTFSQFFPDVEIRMKSMGKDGPNGAHYVDGSDSVIEINTDTNLSYGTILSHEIGHHVERHGLLPNILEEMLGNPEKGKVGIFTKIDKATGKPKITTDENGMKHYELTDEFRELQKAYVDKLANSNVSEKAKQAYETPEQFARELFAEIVAERMLSGKTSKRAGQSSTYKLIESLGDRITSGGFMRKAMHSLGMATKADGSLVQGTGILGKPFKSSKQLDNLVKRYEDETIGLSESEIREQRPVTKDDELDTVIVSPSDPIESLQVFNNGGHFKTDKDGNIIVNPITKKPEVYSPSETRRANQALARDLTESIKARENDLPEGHVTLSETEDGKLTGSGKFIDDSIIDELSRTGRYNPSQINFLREASKAGREGIGNQMLLFYYAATGKGGRKYKTLKGGYRDSLVYGITITKDGNVILDTVSLDKLQKNIDYLLKRRGNEIGQAFGGSDPAVIRKNFESMFEKYLDNHAKGIVNGTPESGITEGQKNFLNAAFGPVSKSQIADNPTLSNLGERRANTLGTYRSRRLDRIGTLNPTGNTRNIVIDRLRRNLMPGRSEADVQITDKLFMPAGDVMTAVNVRNELNNKFADLIVSGQKSIETRRSRSLDNLIGNRVKIVRTTGKGDEARVIGEVTIGEPIQYKTRAEFAKDYDKHLVDEDSDFAFQDGGKFGYPMINPERYDTPYPMPKRKGIVYTKEVGGPNKLFMPASEAGAGKPGKGDTTPASVQSWDDANPTFGANFTKGMAKDNKEAAALLRKSYEDEFGEPIKAQDFTQEQVEWLGGMLAQEGEAALGRTGNAVNWYTSAVEKALSVAEEIFPEIGQKFEAKDRFLGALSITSQNMRVMDNAKAAVSQYQHKIRTGKFNYNIKHGAKADAITSNLKLYDKVEAKMGVDKLNDFLDADFTVKELIEWGRDFFGDKKFSIAGYSTDKVKGSAIFGPKIGQGFFQNLRGNYDPVTVDLWLRRTYGRLTGLSLDTALSPGDIGRIIYAVRNNKGKRKFAGLEMPEFLKGVSISGKLQKNGVANFKISDKAFESLFGDNTIGRDNYEAIYEFAEKLNREWERSFAKANTDVKKAKDAIKKAKKEDRGTNGYHG